MITYEQAVKLVYLGFRLMIIYKLISVVLYLPATIPTIIREVRMSKESKAKMKRDEEAMAKKIDDGTELIGSDYKSTTIGFVTTEPITDKKESS